MTTHLTESPRHRLGHRPRRRPARPDRRPRPPPRRPRLRRRPPAVERRRRPAPRPPWRFPARPPRSPPSSGPPPRRGLRVAPQSTGHNAGPLAAQGLDDVVVVRTSEMSSAIADPVRGIVRVEGGARLGAGRRGRRRPRPGRPARLLARRRHRRLLARRRHRLVRPQARPGHQQPHRRRARDRRRHARARRRHHQPGALLGRARRRRQLRRRHRAGVPDVRHPDGLRRHDGLGPRRIEPVLREWAAWAPAPRTRSPPRSARCGCPRCRSCRTSCAAASSCVIDGAVLGSDERGRGAARRAAGTAPRDRHVRPGAGQVAGPPAHGPRGRGPRASRTARCSARSPTPPSTPSSTRPGRTPRPSLLVAELRQLGGALGRPHEGGGVLSRLDAEFVAFAGASRPRRRWARRGTRTRSGSPRRWRRSPTAGSTSTSPRTRSTPGTATPRASWTQLDGIRSAVDPHGIFAANHPVRGCGRTDRPTS